jgi:hypothetical protein
MICGLSITHQEHKKSADLHSEKTVVGEDGAMKIEVPRDRSGSFEPLLITKGQKRFEGFDEKIIAMYARGMTVREIQGFLHVHQNADEQQILDLEDRDLFLHPQRPGGLVARTRLGRGNGGPGGDRGHRAWTQSRTSHARRNAVGPQPFPRLGERRGNFISTLGRAWRTSRSACGTAIPRPGTSGTGLGAVKRASHLFAMHSQPGIGTALLSEIWRILRTFAPNAVGEAVR